MNIEHAKQQAALLRQAVELNETASPLREEHYRLMNEAADKYGILGNWPADVERPIEALETKINDLESRSTALMAQYERGKSLTRGYEYDNE